LAFHPYPQIIPQVFNPGGFGPPHRLTGASPCPWVDHSASGLQHTTHTPHQQHRMHTPYSDSLSLRLPHHGLTSPHTTTRRLILQKARHHTTPPQGDAGALTACRHMVSGTLSQPLTGALFTFPSRYSSTIGHQGIFRLTTWSWQIHTEFHELRATRDHPKEDAQVSPTGLSPSTVGHPKPFGYPNALSLPAGPAEPAQGQSHNPANATPADYHTPTV
jgi:hypothetical protein